MARQREMNKKVVLGIRPEDIYDYEEAKERGIHMDTQGLEETVSAREMLGAEVICILMPKVNQCSKVKP